MPAELRPVPERVRTRLGSSAPSAPKGTHRDQRTRKATAYAMTCLDAATPADGRPVLEARLLWQTPEMRDTAIDALTTHLGLVDADHPTDAKFRDAVPGTPAVLEWVTPELTVRLRCMKLTGGLGTDLPIMDGARPTRATVTTAIATRRDEAAAFLAADRPGAVPSIALVELDRAADFATPHHDPKFALRLGFAKAGVLTQFLAVPKKVKGYNTVGNAGHRALMAWDDALRQLGARYHTRPSPDTGVPAEMRYAAIWMVRRNQKSRTRWSGYVPVAVLVTPGPEDGTARVQGWDAAADAGAGDWISYPAMLLRLTEYADVSSAAPDVADENDGPVRRPRRRKSMDEQRRPPKNGCRQKVQRSLRGVPTMLLAQAQNARSHWTWLQDGRLEADRIRTGHAPARNLARTCGSCASATAGTGRPRSGGVSTAMTVPTASRPICGCLSMAAAGFSGVPPEARAVPKLGGRGGQARRATAHPGPASRRTDRGHRQVGLESEPGRTRGARLPRVRRRCSGGSGARRAPSAPARGLSGGTEPASAAASGRAGPAICPTTSSEGSGG